MGSILAIGGKRLAKICDGLVVDGTELIEECRDVLGLHAQARLASTTPTDKSFVEFSAASAGS